MGTGSFPGVKRPGRGADHPPLQAQRSRKSRASPQPSARPSGLLRGTFTFTSHLRLVGKSLKTKLNLIFFIPN
jgi:hypothetical protein